MDLDFDSGFDGGLDGGYGDGGYDDGGYDDGGYGDGGDDDGGDDDGGDDDGGYDDGGYGDGGDDDGGEPNDTEGNYHGGEQLGPDTGDNLPKILTEIHDKDEFPNTENNETSHPNEDQYNKERNDTTFRGGRSCHDKDACRKKDSANFAINAAVHGR